MLHKIYGVVIAIVSIGLIFVGLSWLKAHDAWKDFQKDLAVSQEKEKANKLIEKQAQTTIDTASKKVSASTANNSAIDIDTKKKLDSVQAQLNSKPDSATIRNIIQQEIPKLVVREIKDQTGNPVIAVDDTQQNRDALNQADGAFKTCRFNLDDCQQKQKNFLDIIAQKDVIITSQVTSLNAKQSTIDQQEKDLKKAESLAKGGNIWARTGRVALPVVCAAGGAYLGSKTSPGAKSAAIGAITGGGLCAFSFHF